MFKMQFTSYLKDVEKEMQKAEKRQRAKAAKYLDGKLTETTTARFGSDSNITKGVNHINEKYESKVGFGKPAYAAHLVEFGTDTRFTTKGIGSGKKGTGHITASPFFVPTMEEESAAIINIMQEAWF